MFNNRPAAKLVKPSDAKSWSLCARRVWFDNNSPEGLQVQIGEFDQLVIDLGLIHEQTVLEKLGLNHEIHEARSVSHTMQLMEQGVDVIYQAQLLDEEERFIVSMANYYFPRKIRLLISLAAYSCCLLCFPIWIGRQEQLQ